jgi:hypothetical protein
MSLKFIQYIKLITNFYLSKNLVLYNVKYYVYFKGFGCIFLGFY